MTISLYSVAFCHIQSSCYPLIRFHISDPLVPALKSVVRAMFFLCSILFFANIFTSSRTTFVKYLYLVLPSPRFSNLNHKP